MAFFWRIVRSDAVYVWENSEVRRRLSWYYAVMRDERPARFLICRRIAAPVRDLKGLALEELWRIHDELASEFWKVLRLVEKGEVKLEELEEAEVSFLDVKIELAYRMLKSCIFCERRCGVDRTAGKTGSCRVDHRTRVSSWFHHVGEEAPLVPSGTIFYSGCNFHCVFCQNHDISQENIEEGDVVDAVTLARIQRILRREGARNINHVGGDPTPNLHTILESLKYLDVNVPQLWNSNLYCSLEAMKLLREVIDIWLPDFKYGSDECACRLSKVDNYFEIVSRNHRIAAESGDMIIRHLVLPNHLECCTKKVLKWIAENCSRALVNIMGQYRPEYIVARRPELYPDVARRPSGKEMSEAFDYAQRLGLVYEPVS